jgi:hypothetical protein
MKFQLGNLVRLPRRLEIFTLSRASLGKWSFLIYTDVGAVLAARMRERKVRKSLMLHVIDVHCECAVALREEMKSPRSARQFGRLINGQSLVPGIAEAISGLEISTSR